MMDTWIEELGRDPLAPLAGWLAEARAAELFEPEAAALATSTRDGRPSVRMVLVRGMEEGDLRFYTNRESRKGSELSENPRAALVFHWGPPLRRQARAEGIVVALSADESAAYFETRARESRLGAWASPQSRPLADRAELDALLAAAAERFVDAPVPLPTFWGGYRLLPEAVELWQNRPNRLHDRARYERSPDGWTCVRLAP
jgi:pyridoxamine 5'-phosphate oxidase